MKFLIRNPLRVYLLLGTFALVGIFCGFNLPISLFPNSSKVTVKVDIPLFSSTPNEFYQLYGSTIESQLRSIDLKINNFKAEYDFGAISYKLDFDWEVNGDLALSKVKEVMSGLSASFPELMRQSYNVYKWSENRTFVALSFYSQTRSTDEIYEILKPSLEPEVSAVKQVQNTFLYNPLEKQVVVELQPEKLSQFGLTPQEVEDVLKKSNQEFQGGRIEYQDRKMQIFFERQIKSLKDLENFSFYTKGNQIVFLRDIAEIKKMSPENSGNIFRTSGAESMILMAEPKPGANVKIMSEEIVKIVDRNKLSWPSDVQFKFLVNPADFINSSVKHVASEVFIAAILAVFILFLFIGSIKNVITAAIEIPLSIIMAFILMKLFNMNINLISLGGLALSAGMNVDASVVVIENIFRHFKIHPEKNKFDNIIFALGEVYQPILVSTLASLIVFFPIIFTTGLTNSLLGDLAKAVIFSHGLSAIVALVLVPTIRYHLSAWFDDHSESPIEKYLLKLESFYEISLSFFMARKKWVAAVSASVIIALILMTTLALPRLPKEIIGKPATDWLMVFASSKDWQSISDFDEGHSQIDTQLREKYADKISYTFLQVGRGWGNIMVRLKNKDDVEWLKQAVERDYPDSPNLKINTFIWNPSELSIPNPAEYVVNVSGANDQEARAVAENLYNKILDEKWFKNTQVYPNISSDQAVFFKTLRPNFDSAEIAGYINYSHAGHFLMNVSTDGNESRKLAVNIQFPKKFTQTVQNLKSMPFPAKNKIIPLSATSSISFEEEPKGFYRENGKRLISILGRIDEGNDKKRIQELAWQATKKFQDELKSKSQVKVEIIDAEWELHSSIQQLIYAVGISIVLIFLLMVLLFGNWIDGFLILLAIPFGILGTLTSLTLFKSNLSLNSALGVILLNGISVANSIILVDFIKELKSRGLSPRKAAVEASKARLRPIYCIRNVTNCFGFWFRRKNSTTFRDKCSWWIMGFHALYFIFCSYIANLLL